ncbi:Sirtuin family protein [Klebsormidium nitens]|uniref:Sirtuin family protein n=1 Tax=Klebsormidium nitens TaxID=105231 RepID=A0A1Y1HTJ6_KLENI|nr:Sirtuin family protein [Klebsormidium nitens]|eukprot:GAQ81453.1 Sirtuin family protein [Klebsormidium nitens]
MAAVASLAAVSCKALRNKKQGLIGRRSPCKFFAGGQKRRALPDSHAEEANVAQTQDNKLNTSTLLRKYGIKALEFAEPVSAYQLEMKQSVFDKADDWLRAGAAFVLIVDPYGEEFYTYDRRTWIEGRKESPKSLRGAETLAPRPDLFPGLAISTEAILKSIGKPKAKE